MSDIVNQLLFRSSDEAGIGWTPNTVVHVPAGLLHQAADEIARLTARVKELGGVLKRIADDDESDADLNEWGAAAVARAALSPAPEKGGE
jgi:hypothetical protein